MTNYEYAQQRIKEAHETGSRFLYLGGLNLTKLPPEIGQLTKLWSLDISENCLSKLPPEIGGLTSLSFLYLSGNPIKKLQRSLKTAVRKKRLTIYGV